MINIEQIRKAKAKARQEKSLGPMGMGEPYINMPRMSVGADEMPDMKNHEVGKTYTMKVQMRMTGKHEEKSMKPGESEMMGDYEIVGAESAGDNKSKK